MRSPSTDAAWRGQGATHRGCGASDLNHMAYARNERIAGLTARGPDIRQSNIGACDITSSPHKRKPQTRPIVLQRAPHNLAMDTYGKGA